MSWKHNKITDYFSRDFKNKDWGKWTYSAQGANKSAPWPSPPTDDSIIDGILNHPDLEDRGFFEDVVDWLRRDAPRKLRGTLNDLYPRWTKDSFAGVDLSYERLCEAVYKVGFRASEVLVRRMTLGQSNKWVRKYFEDFPPTTKE